MKPIAAPKDSESHGRTRRILCSILVQYFLRQFSLCMVKQSTTPNREDTITLESAERQHILNALEKTHWVVGGLSGPARLLDINRTTLLARMKKMGIERDK